jgi:hypothetical protein
LRVWSNAGEFGLTPFSEARRRGEAQMENIAGDGSAP